MTSLKKTEEFVAAVRAERDEAAAFVALLKAEQRALRDGSAVDVERLAPAKSRMADSLSAHTAKRLAFLDVLGYAPDSRGMHEWARAHPRNPAGVAAWEDLQEHAARAHALNDANGKLIDLRLRHCRQALAALKQACGLTTLYDPQGHTAPMAASRPLTAA
ncbi:MAG TPA: flagellar protein FlgN [Burkholderiales bacterium]|nr:flagellar protein FlgN [Burkholderiales bacterium]